MKRRRFFAVMAGASSVLAAPSIARCQNLASVRIATGVTPPSIHNIFLHVAYERGFFRDNGIEVAKFMQLQGGPLALSAIVSGQVDVAPADPEGLLAATAGGAAIRGVSSPGSRLSYMLAVRKEIETVADLSGKTFAISRPGAISQYLMYPLLDAAGVPRNSVQWVGVGGGHERMRFLQADRVKGALLNIDFAMHTIDDPNIKVIKSIADFFPDYPVELLVLRKQMLEQNPEAATAIVRAVMQACRYIVSDKAGTVEVMLKYVPGMNVAVLNRALDELLRIRGFGVDGGMTVANLTVAHDLAKQNGQIVRSMPLDQWVDFRFQERALASLGPFDR